MNTKQYITILNSVNGAEDLLRASKDIPGVGYSFEDGVAFIKYDFRPYISKRLTEEGLSVRQLAICIGMNYSNLIQYLKGSRIIPEKYLERIIGLLNK